jgi:hypothetical protein
MTEEQRRVLITDLRRRVDEGMDLDEQGAGFVAAIEWETKHPATRKQVLAAYALEARSPGYTAEEIAKAVLAPAGNAS